MNILTIAKYSLQDIIRSKLMINIFWVSLGVFILTYVTSEFSYGRPDKIALDFGLAISSLATCFISIFAGASLVFDEIENRTIYMSLVRPISRTSFIIGKVLGFSAFLFINIIIINIFSVTSYFYFAGVIFSDIFWGILFSLVEAIILMLLVVNFSLIFNKVLSVINTLVIFILGHSIPAALDTTFVKNKEEVKVILKIANYFIPNLEKINIKSLVTIENPISQGLIFNASGYAIFYILFLIGVMILLFNNRDLK